MTKPITGPPLKSRPKTGTTELDPAHVMSADAVAAALGITTAEVYRIERQALHKLRWMLLDQGLTLDVFMAEDDTYLHQIPALKVLK